MKDTENPVSDNSNDNARHGRIWPDFARDQIEAELRSKIERWLHRGIPPERLNEIVFGLSKDLTYYALMHDPVNAGRASERYDQVCRQAGVLQILEVQTRKYFVRQLCDDLDAETAES